MPAPAARYARRVLPDRGRIRHALRALLLVTAMTSCFMAIAHMPLAAAVPAYFVGPLIAVARSAMPPGERRT